MYNFSGEPPTSIKKGNEGPSKNMNRVHFKLLGPAVALYQAQIHQQTVQKILNF
jgi:hypothetical protein